MSKQKHKKHSGKKSKTAKRARSAKKPAPQPKPGNYIDTLVKRVFGWIMVFADFLTHYGDKDFISRLDLKKLKPAPTHYLGKQGDERIMDLVFQCPLKHSNGSHCVRTSGT